MWHSGLLIFGIKEIIINAALGGVANLRRLGINIVPVVTLTLLMEVLQRHGRVTPAVAQEVVTFIANNKTSIKTPPTATTADPSATDNNTSGKHPCKVFVF